MTKTEDQMMDEFYGDCEIANKIKLNSKNINLTHKIASETYAKGWNNLDLKDFYTLMHDNCRYESQYVLTALGSKKEILEYFEGKTTSLKKDITNEYVIVAKIAKIHSPTGYDTGVAIYQGNTTEPRLLVVFSIKDNKINRIDSCIPTLFEFSTY
jgi:hypothetical protein